MFPINPNKSRKQINKEIQSIKSVLKKIANYV